MISQTFITEYLKLFFPNYDERYLDLLEIISDFTDPYIEASNMAIIALDQNKRIVMVNQLAATLFNTSETALLEQEVGQALPVCPLSKVTLDNYAALPKEFSMGEKTVHAERTPIIHDEKTIAVVSFLYEHSDTDTTDQRSIETQKHMQFLNEIIENSYDGIYITDSSGKTILVNKAYERIFGVPRSQLIGEYMKDLVTKGILSTSITQDVVEKKEVITRTQTNANNKEVFITGNPIFDEEGNVHHVITNVRDITELISLNKKLHAEIDRADLYQSQLMKESSDENIVCNSQEFSSILNIARKISRMDSTVLILGETGVGKEIVAQYIHKHSMRDDKPYIKINCGAIPQNLLESELFGYVPGAFTGASAKGKSGMFELADTGTLFLDEIGELPINLQSALLRVLQDHEVTRVGGQKSKKVSDIDDLALNALFHHLFCYRLTHEKHVFQLCILYDVPVGFCEFQSRKPLVDTCPIEQNIDLSELVADLCNKTVDVLYRCDIRCKSHNIFISGLLRNLCSCIIQLTLISAYQYYISSCLCKSCCHAESKSFTSSDYNSGLFF